ncbi:hypothetical protein BC941DRAFT_476730 [Chlamydoabsidia padenii]|nr:hypothetical protein BC941DRAFT_476730 [Chlamydoabsidia padenii]
MSSCQRPHRNTFHRKSIASVFMSHNKVQSNPHPSQSPSSLYNELRKWYPCQPMAAAIGHSHAFSSKTNYSQDLSSIHLSDLLRQLEIKTKLSSAGWKVAGVHSDIKRQKAICSPPPPPPSPSLEQRWQQIQISAKQLPMDFFTKPNEVLRSTLIIDDDDDDDASFVTVPTSIKNHCIIQADSDEKSLSAQTTWWKNLLNIFLFKQT